MSKRDEAVVKVHPRYGEPFVQVAVTFRRIESGYTGQPRYEVLAEGERIGTVERGSITVERRSAGRRYVNSRHTSTPRYWFANGSHTLDYRTRGEAASAVVRDHLRSITPERED